MQLSNIFSATKQTEPVFILCVVVTDASTQTLLLRMQGPHTSVVSKSKRYHYLDVNSLVVKTDEGLQELGPDSEQVNTVVFALEKSWVQGGSVEPAKQKMLDSLVTDLSLKAVGFIEQSEALTHALATQQQAGGVIALLFSQSTITAVLVNQGKTLGEQNIGKSGDTVADVTEALARLHQQAGTLPTKLLCLSALLTDEEIETVQQELLTADWQASDFFLQQPSIELMQEEALLSLLAQQAGVAAHGATQATPAPVEPEKEADGDNFERTTAKSFGISMPVERAVEPDFGFVEEGEIEPVAQLTRRHKPHKFIGIGAGLGIVTLLSLAFIGMYFWSTAVITLTPVSKTISKEIELSLDASIAASDSEARLIKAEQFAAEFSATKTTDSSGVALVGEKAQGTVVIFNKTQEEKTFSAGTSLSIDELVFTLDSDVTIPAAKDTTTTLEYGQGSASVTATAIGAEGNLAKETQLTVESFASSSYSAKSEEDFAGGASREVRVVSTTDLELLVSEAKADILEQATKEFAEKSGSGTYVLPPQQVEVLSSTADNKEGTETDSVTTKVTASVKTLTYKTEDLLPIVTAVLQSEIPEGFVLRDREPEILSAANEEADLSQELTLSVNISSQVVAEIDLDDLRSKVLGEQVGAAKNIVTSSSKIQSAVIELRPSILTKLWGRLPKQEDRITMQVVGADGE